MNALLVRLTGAAPALAFIEDGALVEYRALARSSVCAEQVYMGVIDALMPGIGAAFVRLGGTLKGYLPLRVGEKPRSGERVLVQVKKPPVGDKLAYLTRDVALTGKYVIALPESGNVAISRRVDGEAARARLMARGKALDRGGMGIVLRSESEDADDITLQSELDALKGDWQTLAAAARAQGAPGLLRDAPDPVLAFLRDQKTPPDAIFCDAPERLPVQNAQKANDPFALHNVADKLEKSLRRRVYLKCGGYLVVDPCEAMTVIDVNSGKCASQKRSLEETARLVNLEAAREAARLARLRGMGGIVLIDFIDMRTEAYRQEVLAALSGALARDPVKTVVHGFTRLGLCEITRKRTGEAMESVKENVCPRCGGTGLCGEDTDAQ